MLTPNHPQPISNQSFNSLPLVHNLPENQAWRQIPGPITSIPQTQQLLYGSSGTVVKLLTNEELLVIHQDFASAKAKGLSTCYSGSIKLGYSDLVFDEILENSVQKRLTSTLRKVTGGEEMIASLVLASRRALVAQHSYLQDLEQTRSAEQIVFVGISVDFSFQVAGKKYSRDANVDATLNGNTQVLHTHFYSPQRMALLDTGSSEIFDLSLSVTLLGEGTVYFDVPNAHGKHKGSRQLPVISTADIKNNQGLPVALQYMDNFEKENSRHRQETKPGEGLLIQPKLPHRAPSELLDNKKSRRQILNLSASEAQERLSYLHSAPRDDRIHLTTQFIYARVGNSSPS